MATCCYVDASCYSDTSATWTLWVDSSATCTGTTTTSGSSVWVTWVSDSTTATTLSTNFIWNSWASSSVVRTVTRQQPTAQQIRKAEAAQQRAAEEEKQRKAAASARATELLRANLSQKQREALDKNGWFLVEGGKSKKTYRVHGDRYAGNIHELDRRGKEVARYCVHADYTIPLGDQLLTQALSLRFDEDHIVSKANKTALAA